MSFELEFLEEALVEWKRLDGAVREQSKKKLTERLNEPRVPAARLSGGGETSAENSFRAPSPTGCNHSNRGAINP